MAGEDLYGALAGLNYDPAETGWGTGSQVLASSLPSLMNPYQSAGTNIGIALGGALISGLLGYQARQSAAEQSLEANRLGLQLLEAQTPQARLGIIESTPDTVMQEKLLGVNTRLAAQQAAMKQLVDQEVAKRTGLAKFELGPEGEKLFQRELEKIETARPRVQGEKKKDFFANIGVAQQGSFTGMSGQVRLLRNLAQQYKDLNANAVELNIQKAVPGSKANLADSALQSLVSGTVKMLGDTGNLAVQEQENIKNATLGGVLSGSESIAARLEQLANLAETRTIATLEDYKTATEQGGNALLESMKARAAKTPAEQRNEELKARLAKLEVLAAQRK
jgi:predicted transcriptional regulator